MQKIILILTLAITIGTVGYLAVTNREPDEAAPRDISEKFGKGKEWAITYLNDNFSPNNMIVKAGESLKFLNNSPVAIQVSSDPHPIHTSHPAFESGRLEPGQSWTFIAKEKMVIRYHNHRSASAVGMIIIEN